MFICIVLTCFECQFIFSLTKNSVSENSDPKPEPNLVPAEPIWFRLAPIWFRLQKFSSECYSEYQTDGNHAGTDIYVLDARCRCHLHRVQISRSPLTLVDLLNQAVNTIVLIQYNDRVYIRVCVLTASHKFPLQYLNLN